MNGISTVALDLMRDSMRISSYVRLDTRTIADRLYDPLVNTVMIHRLDVATSIRKLAFFTPITHMFLGDVSSQEFYARQ